MLKEVAEFWANFQVEQEGPGKYHIDSVSRLPVAGENIDDNFANAMAKRSFNAPFRLRELGTDPDWKLVADNIPIEVCRWH
jgi:trehalose/maltose hydrolase-like predicted phosphorylase